MKQVTELREAHRRALNVREAYRINAVILLSQGWKPVEVAKALLLDEDSVRTYFKRYKEGGINRLLKFPRLRTRIKPGGSPGWAGDSVGNPM